MGTRFMFTVESPIHEEVKAAIVAASERDTELMFRPLRNTARVASNSISGAVVETLDQGGTFEDVRALVAGVRGKQVYETEDLEAGVWSVGMVQGLIHDVPTVDALVQRIVSRARELVQGRLAGMITDPRPVPAL